MIPFFDRMLSFVRADGKEPILWCELDNIRMPANDYLFPYPKDVTLVSWRYGLTPTCQELTRQHGNPLIMAPGEFAYLDYPQFKGDLPNSTIGECLSQRSKPVINLIRDTEDLHPNKHIFWA